MEFPMDLLNQALAVYREELERNLPDDGEFIKQLSAEVKATLPENVRDYLQITNRPGGGHYFWLIIPGCMPISLTFTRRISGLELKSVSVVNEETRKSWSSSNILLAIGYARDLYLQSEIIGGELVNSDIGSRVS